MQIRKKRVEKIMKTGVVKRQKEYANESKRGDEEIIARKWEGVISLEKYQKNRR